MLKHLPVKLTQKCVLLLPLLLTTSISLAQTSPFTLPAGTPLPVQIDDHIPMRVGQLINAQLIYPVYADDTLILPEKTIVTGTVVELRANRARRIDARLRADFTPFYTPVVQFTAIRLADGTTIPITTGTATDGAPIYRLVAPPPRTGSFIHRQFDSGVQIFKDQVSVFTAPGKGDRALQFLYTQLPYHPQRIQKGTAWTVEISAPISLSAPPPTSTTQTVDTSSAITAAASATSEPAPWIIQAYLSEGLCSASSKSAQLIHATVAEPIYNNDHTIAVPQGATIVGAITQAKPARRFGRAGTLRFDFRQIVLPSGQTQNVSATLTGLDSASDQKLAMDSEGTVKPKPQDKILVPLLLIALAARPLHQDHEDGASSGLGKNATASNSIGLIGFIVGTASGSANVASGFGAYGAALALYNRWIKRGGEITFARDTRIVLQTTPRRSAILKPTNPASELQ